MPITSVPGLHARLNVLGAVGAEMPTMVLFVAPLKPRAPATVLTRDLLDPLRSGETMTLMVDALDDVVTVQRIPT